MTNNNYNVQTDEQIARDILSILPDAPEDPNKEPAESPKVFMLPIRQLKSFQNHPFKIVDNDEMKDLMHSIRDYGVMTPMFDLKNKLERLDTAQNSSGNFIRAIRKFMTMQTLTPIVLQELIDKIEVFPIEGTGKNRTQRLVIHYRFVGCIDLPSIVPKHTYKLDSRQGVAIEYLPSAV